MAVPQTKIKIARSQNWKIFATKMEKRCGIRQSRMLS